MLTRRYEIDLPAATVAEYLPGYLAEKSLFGLMDVWRANLGKSREDVALEVQSDGTVRQRLESAAYVAEALYRISAAADNKSLIEVTYSARPDMLNIARRTYLRWLMRHPLFANSRGERKSANDWWAIEFRHYVSVQMNRGRPGLG